MQHFTFDIAFGTEPETLKHGSGTQLLNEPDLTLVGDIKLYNKQELRAALQPDVSDFEILACAYREWGIDCLQRLVGDFSFVLWDRGKKVLFAARDHLGVRQLYYKGSPEQQLHFSSSIRKIMGGKIDSSETIDEEVLVDYLLGLYPEPDRTIISSLCQLPPGHYLTVSNNRLRVQRYWVPVIKPQLPAGPFDKRQFLAVLEAVLRSRWDETKNNIMLLSGGLDSTSLLCALRYLVKVEKNRVSILSHLAPRHETDSDGGDLHYIQLVLAQLGMEARFTAESPDGLGFSTLVNYFDSQFRMPWSPLVTKVSPLEKEYSQTKNTIVISGLGGDETVSIDPDDKALYLFFSCRFVSLLRCLRRFRQQSGLGMARLFYHKVLFRLLPRNIQDSYRRLRGVSVFDGIENSFIHPSLMCRKTQEKRIGDREKSWRNWNRDPRREIRNTVCSGYFTAPLEHAAVISERSGVNFNLPFLDRRIIEFCLQVPGIEYVRDGVGRCFLRNCMRDLLPEEITRRETKQLISHTDDISMLLNREIFQRVTKDFSSPAWKYIDRERLAAAYGDLEEGRVPEKDRPSLGAHISRGLCAAAFVDWFEKKKSESAP